MEEVAYAKINLALHVRGREPDGYHRIETLFAFAEDGDILTAATGEGLRLTVTGPFAAALESGENNLALRAARALGGDDVTLNLEKSLPVASGIGGGSADAAAALRLLRRFWGGDLDDDALRAVAATLGADVSACVASRTARGTGRGDELVEVFEEGLAGTPLLLVNPGLPLSTAAVFKAWDGVDRGPLENWRSGRNDLEAPARQLVPEIAAVLDALAGAEFARMSGSGATCFGLYASETERDAAVDVIAAAHPDWWLLGTRLRS
ncbi:MAG TPA: 4-(cytidine 5'-diphospho)-2-C-methyl-D-erythritol kinase [Allosphingosinicella sp.]|jgi:4-diphosphocytidyl-2-C-methyl-D-erythritol kinase